MYCKRAAINAEKCCCCQRRRPEKLWLQNQKDKKLNLVELIQLVAKYCYKKNQHLQKLFELIFANDRGRI